MNYYGNNAYNATQIPTQAKATQWGKLKQFAQSPLPWGHTEQVAPNLLFKEHSPQYMQTIRFPEEEVAKRVTAQTYSLDETNNEIDQQAIRYSPLAFRTRLFVIVHGMAKLCTFFIGFLAILSLFMIYFFVDLEHSTFEEHIFVYLMMWLPCPIVWLFTYLIMRFLPSVWFAVGNKAKGFLFELNRRTGMVSIRKDHFSAPFYEWDAYIHTFPGQSGVMFHRLYLNHRYHINYTVDLNYFSAATSIKDDLYAAWDFIQNYMDTSQPLPDIPLFEQWRPYDPVSLTHDQQTGRDPDYWRNMDEATWQQQVKQMSSKIYTLAPYARYDIMLPKLTQ